MVSESQSSTHFNRILPQPRITRMGTDKLQGCAWASQAAIDFQIPSQASLHGIVKPHRSFCYANGPAFCASRKMWKIEKNTGLRLFSKRGDVVKKHPQAPLERVFSTTNPAFAQQIKPVIFSVFLFDSFAPTYLIRRFSQPAPPSELPSGSLS